MTEPHTIEIRVALPEDEAWAIAQFLKRVGFSDYRSLAIDKTEAYTMIDAGERIRAALATEGIAPR